MRNLRIGYISSISPNDRRGSSGTMFTIAAALRSQGYDVQWVPVKHSLLFRWLQKYLGAFVRRILKKNLLFSYTKIGAWLLSRTLSRDLLVSCDVLVAPLEAPAISGMDKCGKPLVYISDATFTAMLGYYPVFSNLVNESSGREIERRALDTSDAIVVSSDWARNSVVADYAQLPEKVTVVEFGANLSEEDVNEFPAGMKSADHVHILFLGVDWVRKGGDLAVEACRELRRRNVDVTLHVVGIRDLREEVAGLEFVVNHGFLDKNREEDYRHLVGVISKCHCLLLPTMAECSAIAFAESSAFGLPVFSHATGGVANYVLDGVNGYLLPLGSTGGDFAQKISDCLNTGEMSRMSETARELYRKTLNWNVWGQKVSVILARLSGRERG